MSLCITNASKHSSEATPHPRTSLRAPEQYTSSELLPLGFDPIGGVDVFRPFFDRLYFQTGGPIFRLAFLFPDRANLFQIAIFRLIWKWSYFQIDLDLKVHFQTDRSESVHIFRSPRAKAVGCYGTKNSACSRKTLCTVSARRSHKVVLFPSLLSLHKLVGC